MQLNHIIGIYVSRCPVHIVIDVLLKLQNLTYLYMSSPASNSKLRTSHKDIILL